eukprot:950433-Pleurochrysis_carterae.AAC.5
MDAAFTASISCGWHVMIAHRTHAANPNACSESAARMAAERPARALPSLLCLRQRAAAHWARGAARARVIKTGSPAPCRCVRAARRARREGRREGEAANAPNGVNVSHRLTTRKRLLSMSCTPSYQKSPTN